MKKLLMTAGVLALCGCTSCGVIDVANGDMFGYRYFPWENRDAEEAAARARYWGSEGPKHYGTNQVLKLEMKLTLVGTNTVYKNAVYEFRGTGEKVKLGIKGTF